MIPKIRVFAKAGTKPLYGGWDDRDQMFYEISEIDYYNKTVTVWGCHNKDCGTCDDTYNMEDVEIMMSTGLKDKNGVEIFEGDINLSFYQGEPNNTYLIKYSLDARHSGAYVDTISGYEFSEPTQVIGNIYENPDLLEGVE